MVGLNGNDTYVVDDLLDVVVEAAGAGTDTVQTEMAALSIELMANVENLNTPASMPTSSSVPAMRCQHHHPGGSERHLSALPVPTF